VITVVKTAWHRGISGPNVCEGLKFLFRQATVFCLGYCLSKYKMTRYSKNLGVMAPRALLPMPMAWNSIDG